MEPLRNLSSSDPPDCVVLHRKVGTPQGIMQHECKCHPQSAQAEQLLEMVQVTKPWAVSKPAGLGGTNPAFDPLFRAVTADAPVPLQQSRVKYCESYRGIRETEPLTPVTSPSQIIITAAIGYDQSRAVVHCCLCTQGCLPLGQGGH